MAFAALGQSLSVAKDRYMKQLKDKNASDTVRSIESEYANVRTSLKIPATGNIPSNALLTNQPITFDIKRNDTLALKNGHSMYLIYKAQETGGTNPVVVSWAETVLNTHSGIDWLMDGTPIESMPMMQAIIAPIEYTEIQEYKNASSYAGHDETLVYTSSTSIAANATQVFQFPLPTILPVDEPFWLGALGTHTLSVRINTQQQGIKYSGTGTLSIPSDGMWLKLECISVAESQYSALKQKWADYSWDSEKWILNELPYQVTTVNTGESPKAKLDSFKDLPLERFFVYQLASRNSPTSGAMLQWIAPQNTSLFHLEDQAGTKMFSSDKEYYKYNKVTTQNDQYANSAIINAPFVLITANTDLAASRLEGKKTVFNFTGQENFVWTDFGTNAGAMYVDMIGVQPVRYGIKNGVISRLY